MFFFYKEKNISCDEHLWSPEKTNKLRFKKIFRETGRVKI